LVVHSQKHTVWYHGVVGIYYGSLQAGIGRLASHYYYVVRPPVVCGVAAFVHHHVHIGYRTGGQ